jgi:hypothetical protein
VGEREVLREVLFPVCLAIEDYALRETRLVQGSSKFVQCMSPLLAQSGHPDALNQCPLLGVKRTLRAHALMFQTRFAAMSSTVHGLDSWSEIILVRR